MKVLVTGASGFVGKKLAFKLLEMNYEVIAIARKPLQDLIDKGARCYSVDLNSNFLELDYLFNGVDAIFHVAAKVDMWGEYEDFYQTNFVATKLLLEACLKYNISKFIFTSSPSVITNGENLINVNESLEYPNSYLAHYPKTKAMAEKEVLKDNSEKLKTIALRPHLIFGPGDQNFIPTILERAQANKLVQVGRGDNLVDFTFIEDCIDAHIKALFALDSNPNASGRAYFISQGEPWSLWEWINSVLLMLNEKPVTKKIPFWLANFLAVVFESICKILNLEKEPVLTRFLVCEMATSHYFDISAARQELGFVPKYSMKEALRITKEFYQNDNE